MPARPARLSPWSAALAADSAADLVAGTALLAAAGRRGGFGARPLTLIAAAVLINCGITAAVGAAVIEALRAERR